MKVGVDLIEIERIRRALDRHGESFKARCFTDAERAYCDAKPNPPQHYAGRFAAKVGAGTIELSMTHSRELAAAIAVALPA